MTKEKPVCGTIMAILDAGSVLALSLGVTEGQIVPVYIDRQPFEWLLEGERCSARELIGRKIAYDGEAMVFLDRKESD